MSSIVSTVVEWLGTSFYLVLWALSFVFQWSAITGTFGFVCGLLLGLLVGYWLFIFGIPLKVEEPTITGLWGEDGRDVDEKNLKRVMAEIPIWVIEPDYDRVDWINSLLREMWPFIDKAVEAQVKDIVGPMLKERKPTVLQSLDFDELSLGTLPPTLAGIKVYDTTDNEVILQPMLKWAGNPNILLAARACGLKATVQLVDLTIFATIRITLKPLVPVFPCFARMTVSLMSRPTVDFGLKIIGGDVMAIPGLYTFIQETIKNVVADMMLWPKVYEVFKADDASQKKYVGWLIVKNLLAKNLKNIERFGVVDPYVKLSLGGLATKNTSVKYNQLNPSWPGEEFQLVVTDPETQMLEISIYDKEVSSRDKLMSVQRFPLKELLATPGEAKPVQLAMKKNKAALDAQPPTNDTSGQLCFDALYRPFSVEETAEFATDDEDPRSAIPSTVPPGGGLLRVKVQSGQSLETKGSGSPNPYVIVRFRGEERQTKVLKNTPDGEFDHPLFEFVMDESPREEELHVSVWSKEKRPVISWVKDKEAVGFVDIPLSDVVANGRINDVYQLNECRNGKLKIELQWIEQEERKQEPLSTSGSAASATGALPTSGSAASATGA
eukprot:TRINITY_DN170_c0_g2_i1.p1 TRINITY_DN170_c0_g2~~TRINITY_DN170_c0_g2_i1.p1  ORF type:complete len:609 (-),score=168.12 TRINITY_DN170_c0_g2_i1:585-2411(-)